MMGEFFNLSQRLGSLHLDTPPQVLVILRRKQLLAHSGLLPFTAVEELVSLINSMSKFFSSNIQKQLPTGLQRSGYGDLVRFIQLQATQENYLLYVIYLTRDILLASLYGPEIPFNKVRKQTIHIARELQAPTRSTSLEFRASEAFAEFHSPESSKETINPGAVSQIAETQPTQGATKSAGEFQKPIDTQTSYPQAATSSEPGQHMDSSQNYREDEALEQVNSRFEAPAQTEDIAYHESAELIETSSSDVKKSSPGNLMPDQNLPELAQETTTLPSSFGHYITYSCLLIPRMPQHLLNSNLASYLFKWMGQLCLAYGWRLEHLSIHSNHIQWIAGAPLTTSPAYLVRILRQKTSSYIFTQFPPLSTDNPSGDFWAPGFFISGGKQSIQAHLIDKYIDEIREHQGANNPVIYQ